MTFDYSMLRGRIVELFGTQYELADAMKISNMSLSNKLNNKTGFNQHEIVEICKLLEIEENQIADYFFKLKN